MKEYRETYKGQIRRDVFGSWDDCSPGLYIDHDMVESIFNNFTGKTVRVTIEVIEPSYDE